VLSLCHIMIVPLQLGRLLPIRTLGLHRQRRPNRNLRCQPKALSLIGFNERLKHCEERTNRSEMDIQLMEVLLYLRPRTKTLHSHVKPSWLSMQFTLFVPSRLDTTLLRQKHFLFESFVSEPLCTCTIISVLIPHASWGITKSFRLT